MCTKPFNCLFETEDNVIFVSPSVSFCLAQNAMPLSSAVFKSEHKNPVPQCPPRLDVQTINAVLWSRMPNTFLKVETARVNERHGWVVQCVEPLQMLAVHIPEENRYSTWVAVLIRCVYSVGFSCLLCC